jgi:hypothetical protein
LSRHKDVRVILSPEVVRSYGGDERSLDFKKASVLKSISSRTKGTGASMVVHMCNTSYLGGEEGEEDCSSKTMCILPKATCTVEENDLLPSSIKGIQGELHSPARSLQTRSQDQPGQKLGRLHLNKLGVAVCPSDPSHCGPRPALGKNVRPYPRNN